MTHEPTPDNRGQVRQPGAPELGDDLLEDGGAGNAAMESFFSLL